MKKHKSADTGEGISTEPAEWSFRGDVPEAFTDHISKSVPLYNQGHTLVVELSEFFVCPDSVIYDLGCSTGNLTTRLADRHRDKGVEVIGIDIEPAMVEKAGRDNRRENIIYKETDLLTAEIQKTDFIIAYYTIQFTPPRVRQLIFDKLFNSLNWGGALVVFEKVRAPDARFQDYMTQLYNEYKISMGYSEQNIIAKSRSLKRVLEPYSTEANYAMMQRAGFTDIMTVQKYICFEGILAIK